MWMGTPAGISPVFFGCCWLHEPPLRRRLLSTLLSDTTLVQLNLRPEGGLT